MKKMREYALSGIAALFLFAASGACGGLNPAEIRPPAVAGQFYPSEPATLKMAIQQFLKDSAEIPVQRTVAIIVPHAGYIYSGQICADAYRQVMGQDYEVVVILGVNHTTENFKGVALAGYSGFRTPLGDVQVDEAVTSALLAEDRDCVRNREVHEREHSIEVQIPFIQVLFPTARIVPAIVHPPDTDICARFGNALGKVLKGRSALIVISSDLSHYPDADDATRIDRITLETIARLDPAMLSPLMRSLNAPNLATRACGEAAIQAGMIAARALGTTRAVVVSYANSGDIAVGDRSRAVGYGAVVLAQGGVPSDTKILNRPAPPSIPTPMQEAEKKSLLAFARETIRRYLTMQTVPMARNLSPRMDFHQGAFVTLNKSGQLRGCIGHLTPDCELGKTVGAMAIQAALNDPRFPPVTLGELKNIEIEISVLTPMQSITSPDKIVVGRDGVLLIKGGSSAVFLPQVAAENRWDRTEMLDNLCRKAVLPAGCWKRDARFQVFQAEVFGDHQFK
jgi:MEMO1 family protein